MTLITSSTAKEIAYVVFFSGDSKRNCITTVDFFLWGYLKDRIYIGKRHTTEKLKQSIDREITAIPVDMLNRTLRDMRYRALECFIHDGSVFQPVCRERSPGVWRKIFEKITGCPKIMYTLFDFK